MAPGTWRFSFDTAHGAFNTTHVAECPDVAPECATETIPPHLHRVRLGVTHYEVSADYGLRNNMQLSLRLPYDIKAQRVHYATLSGAPYVPPYGDIHHRTETLRGISDGTILLDWSPQSQWIFGLGTTLPFGHIAPNPIVLGRLGLKHEHIQFGSGTFEHLSGHLVRASAPAAFPSLRASTASIKLSAGGAEKWMKAPGFRTADCDCSSPRRSVPWSLVPVSTASYGPTASRGRRSVRERRGRSRCRASSEIDQPHSEHQ